jgi:hypothetical protein
MDPHREKKRSENERSKLSCRIHVDLQKAAVARSRVGKAAVSQFTLNFVSRRKSGCQRRSIHREQGWVPLVSTFNDYAQIAGPWTRAIRAPSAPSFSTMCS